MRRLTLMVAAAAMAAGSVSFVSPADAETRVFFRVKEPGGEVIREFRGRPGEGLQARAFNFAERVEGEQVIVKIVERDGVIVSKERARETSSDSSNGGANTGGSESEQSRTSRSGGGQSQNGQGNGNGNGHGNQAAGNGNGNGNGNGR